MNFPVFDLHCDTAYALLGKDFRSFDSLLDNDLHVDLTRAGKLDGYAQCFACFSSPLSDACRGIPPEEVFERELAVIQWELEKNHSLIRQTYNAQDVEANYKSGIMSAILSIEGPAGFGYDPVLLEDLYKIGFRITTLGWNEDNPLVGSHLTGGGLTDLGREYVKEAQRLGMLVDVSHISDQGFWDIIDITNAPIVATHSNSRSVCKASRNLTDDMFRAICQTGGVAGINFYKDFIGLDGDLSSACRHVLHFLTIDPEGKHIALGGDLDGCDKLPDGFLGIQSYPQFADALLAHGVSDEMLKDIFWNNALGVFKTCCM